MSATVSTLLQDINIKDGNFVDRLDNRTLYQANDYKLQLTFLDGNDRADGTDLAFSFVVQSTSGEVFDIAGSWTTATSGEGTITVPAASLNFTGTDYIGLIRFNGSVVAEFPLVVKAYGTPAPAAGTVIDWSIYTGYTNTATDGPVRPGTGITNVVNADGSNTHSVTYGSSASTAAEGNDARLSDARTPTAHASTHATGGSDPVTAADVDPAGTAIAAALLAKADDNAVVKLTGETDQTVEGIIRTSGGSAMGSTVRAATAITLGSVGTDIAKIRIGTSNETVFESLIEGADLILRARAGGETTGDIRVGDLGESVYIGILKALATTGLVVQDSAGTEKLKVGADTGADVQVTGTLSTTDTLTAETAIGKAVSVNAQTGTSYTLVLGDAGLIVTMTNASANTLTIPTNASVAYATGTVINVIMGGAGTTSITGDTGVTVNGISAGSGDISAQYQGVALIKTGTDTWIASGAIGTVA
jgi:hypothetical protein